MSQVDRRARELTVLELVERGLFHGTSPILTVSNLTNSFISITTGAAKEVHVYISFTATSQFVVNAYIAPTITSPGTVLPIGNFNVGKPNIATVVLRQDPTVSDNGTKIADFLVPGGADKTAVGGAAVNATKVILPPNQVFLLELDNQSTVGPQLIEVNFNFHEK